MELEQLREEVSRLCDEKYAAHVKAVSALQEHRKKHKLWLEAKGELEALERARETPFFATPIMAGKMSAAQSSKIISTNK